MAAHLMRLAALLGMVASCALAADPPSKTPADAEIKKLQDRIKELEEQLDPARKPNRVSRLTLSGQVDHDTARLKARLVLVTSRPRVQVPIAFEKAWATGVSLPKGCILLPAPPGEDGFIVQVEEPGDDHQVTLDLEVPVSTRGAKGTERGFEVGLPRAAITLIDQLDLPPAVREVRITGRPPLLAKEISSKNAGRQPIPAPSTDRLEIAWRGPAPTQPEPLLASQAVIDVRVDDAYVTTEAELTLALLRGQTSQWQVQLPPPPQATLELDEPNSDRAAVLPPEGKSPFWTIQLKEPSAEPVKVRIRHLQQRGKQAIPIGPFAVPGAVRQQGTILIGAGPSVRLRSVKTRGAISPREPNDEQRKLGTLVAVYGYWSLPAAADPKQAVPPPLELEVETVKGAVETSVNHGARLTLAGWQVVSELKVKPVRTEVEHIEVELPASYELKASPPILVEPDIEVKEQGGRRIGVIKLARPQTQEFKVTLEGMSEPGDPRLTVLPLARPSGTLDGGGRVAVSVPDGFELTIARDGGQQALPADRREHSWRTDRAPNRLELAWREHRVQLPVDILADLTVTDRHLRVRQHLRFRFEEPLKQILLKAPAAPRELSPIGVNATLVRHDQQPGAWLAALQGSELTIDFTLPLPPPEPGQRGRLTAVPLLWPEGATQVRTRVRAWSDPNLQLALGPGSGGGWQEQALERVAERDVLPVLVLAGSGAEKLNLTLTEPAGLPLPQLALDRVLVQATTADGGHQTYRTRFLIQKISSRHIDLELPAPPVGLNLEVFLDGKRISNLAVVDAEGREVELGNIVRLTVEPELYRQAVVLEVRYQVPPGRARGDGGRWLTSFTPPRLRGNVSAGRVRWQLDLPPDWVVVGTDANAWPEQRWGLRGVLLGPLPAPQPLDVERWFAGQAAELPADAARPWDLVAWQADLKPLAVYHVFQQGWLLVCSLTLLAIGLTLSFAPLPRRVFWGILTFLGAVLVIASIFWPNTLAAIAYGAEPGAAVLLVVVFFQWFFQRRYRRQVVFMPGFTRLGTGSSLVKHGSSHRPRSEPSTVDAPVGSIPDIGSRYGVPSKK